jgi:hypothetical protein
LSTTGQGDPPENMKVPSSFSFSDLISKEERQCTEAMLAFTTNGISSPELLAVPAA